MEETAERILKLLKENVSLEKIKKGVDLETNLEEIGVSSVDFIKLIVGIENEFDIEFDDEHLSYEKFKTVRDLIDYLDELKKNEDKGLKL